MDEEEKTVLKIDKVAQIIALDKDGNIIKSDDKKKKTIKSKNRLNKINLLLIILIFITFILIIYNIIIMVPKFKKYEGIDVYTTTTQVNYYYPMDSFRISENDFIKDESEFKIDDNYLINIYNNDDNIDILVNKKHIVTTKSLMSSIGIIDDLLIFGVKGDDNLSTYLYIIDRNGNEIRRYHNIDDNNLLLFDNYSYSFSDSGLRLNVSKVYDKKILVGNQKEIDLCNKDDLNKYEVKNNNIVEASYYIEYLGNKNFSKAKKLVTTSLEDYLSEEKICN